MAEQKDGGCLYCAACGAKNCARISHDSGKFPKGCPTDSGSADEYVAWYQKDPQDWTMATTSARISPDHSEPRLLKTIRFAKECGFTRVGFAFCMTLREQAAVVDRILRENGLDVYSVVCKVGCVDREFLGSGKSDKAMCHPIGQAMLLNKAGTQLNIMMGLCVGHDSLFIKYSEAPVTVLAAKDHVYDNAPLRYLEDYLKAKNPGGEVRAPQNKDV